MHYGTVLIALLATALAGCGGSSAGEQEAQSPTLPAEATAPVLDFRLEGWERTDFARHSVPFDEFLSGGPPKDGIPALDAPRFAAAAATTYLEPREPVIELTVGGETRAYPLQILIWHEIVNDELGGVPVAVTFCPLCNTAIAFDRRVEGRTLDFGTTGKLRHSDLVMYDRQTESWWQQFGAMTVRLGVAVLLVTCRVTGRFVWSISVDTASSRRFRTSVFFSVMRSPTAITAFGSQARSLQRHARLPMG